MGSSTLFACLCIAATVASVASVSSVSCLDGSTCGKLKILVSSPEDLEDVFLTHPSATHLDLQGNILERLPANGFFGLRSVIALNLSYNLLENVALNSAAALQLVDLTYNLMTFVSIPASVTNFLAVNNKLVNVEIPQNSQLEVLILAKNHIESLEHFPNARKLKSLDLSCNRLKELNFGKLSQMTDLKELDVANNRIVTVSGTASLKKLISLDLTNNALTMLGNVAPIAPKLSVLSLRNNNLIKVDNNLNGLPQLQSIDLRGNDWECNDLQAIRPNNGRVKTLLDQGCPKGKDGLCCTVSQSPYGDRLQKYYERVFDALESGSSDAQRAFQQCRSLKSSPCDRDDNLVFDVARKKGQNDLNDLKQRLRHEETIVNTMRTREQRSLQETSRLRGPVNELMAYIDDEYKKKGLSGARLPVAKIQQTVQIYDQENDEFKTQIDEELDVYRGKLDEINDLEAQMEEIRHRLNIAQQDANKRNGTVTEYRKKISALKARLGLPQ